MIEKDINLFPASVDCRDKPTHVCKDCTKQRYAGRYEYRDNKEKRVAYQKTWRRNNMDKVRASAKRKRAKPLERIKRNLRDRMKDLLKGETKSDSSVGCTTQELKSHLESKFQQGMSWDNYGGREGRWHIDHIKPLVLFDLTKREDRYTANHYTNLQPLWFHQNEAKSSNYDPDHPMGWHGLDALIEETASIS